MADNLFPAILQLVAKATVDINVATFLDGGNRHQGRINMKSPKKLGFRQAQLRYIPASREQYTTVAPGTPYYSSIHRNQGVPIL